MRLPVGKIVKGFTALLVAVFIVLWLAKAGVILYGRTYPEERYKAIAPVETLVESFIEVVHTYDSTPKGKYLLLRKWTVPMDYAFFTEFSTWHQEFIIRQLDLLARLTGLDFEKASTPSENNKLHLYYSPFKKDMIEIAVKYGFTKREMKDLVQDHKCFALSQVYDEKTLATGIVVIGRTIKNRRTKRCIVEELTQAMELPADKARYLPSVFTNEGYAEKLSINDKILVRTLYDERIKPGMTQAETTPLARQIITELVAAVKEKGEAALYQK